MKKFLRIPRCARLCRFLRCQDGAVTVDWIVLTAALVTLGVAAVFFVGSAVPELADQLNSFMSNYEVGN